MNTGSCSYVSLFKMVLLLIFSCDMTGCAVINLMQAAPVSEEMTPQSVICGKDGSIAIRVTSSYTHLSFPTLFAYQHFWIFFESLKQDKDYDPYKEIPVKFHKPRDRLPGACSHHHPGQDQGSPAGTREGLLHRERLLFRSRLYGLSRRLSLRLLYQNR